MAPWKWDWNGRTFAAMGVGAFAGGLGGGIGAGVGGLSGAIWGGLAAGAANGGGMAAISGGGFSDIFAGAVGGGLIGGSMAFVGGAAMMGISNAIGNIPLSNKWNVRIPADGYSGQGIVNPQFKHLVNHVTNGIFSNNGGLGGSLSGSVAGNLFQFASLSNQPARISPYNGPYVDQILSWMDYIQQESPSNLFYKNMISNSEFNNRGGYNKYPKGYRVGNENGVQYMIADPQNGQAHYNSYPIDSYIRYEPNLKQLSIHLTPHTQGSMYGLRVIYIRSNNANLIRKYWRRINRITDL